MKISLTLLALAVIVGCISVSCEPKEEPIRRQGPVKVENAQKENGGIISHSRRFSKQRKQAYQRLIKRGLRDFECSCSLKVREVFMTVSARLVNLSVPVLPVWFPQDLL
jgi:hypothetical protein